ncbi:MAG: flagellar type III secretion system pore protein FliP [Treponemataceae bacterium]
MRSKKFTKEKKLLFVFLFFTLFFSVGLYAQNSLGRGTAQMPGRVNGIDVPIVDLSITQPATGKEVAFSVQLMLLLTVLSLAPSILILLTCFLRFSIVLDFIKRALSLQQVPPTTVLNGIAFFMTVFVMWPTFTQIYNNSFKPMSDGQIGLNEAIVQAEAPLRVWMFQQLDGDEAGIATFMGIAKMKAPRNPSDVPTYVLIPAYILHELTAAFKIGVLLYIPFIVIDMVVASILMSMGMIMLPPVQISMPFKLMVFILVDGWNLLTQQLFISIGSGGL